MARDPRPGDRDAVDDPLYLSEKEIARRVLGPGSEAAWKGLAQALERQGLPQKDTHLGRRFWPAVVAFFYRRAGIGNMVDASALTDNQQRTGHPPPAAERGGAPPAGRSGKGREYPIG